MKNRFSNADRLDPSALTRDGMTLEAVDELSAYRRLSADLRAPVQARPVRWSARGERRSGASGADQPWLHLQAEATLSMTCQRCLEPVDVALDVNRSFRFVADEATAAAQDEDAEEEVLALDAEFSLRRLVEDELLLALPIVPMHEQCPTSVRLTAADPGFDENAAAAASEENPFAVLERLRRRDPG